MQRQRRDRQADGQTDRQIGQTDRQMDTQAAIEKGRETETEKNYN